MFFCSLFFLSVFKRPRSPWELAVNSNVLSAGFRNQPQSGFYNLPNAVRFKSWGSSLHSVTMNDKAVIGHKRWKLAHEYSLRRTALSQNVLPIQALLAASWNKAKPKWCPLYTTNRGPFHSMWLETSSRDRPWPDDNLRYISAGTLTLSCKGKGGGGKRSNISKHFTERNS